LGLPLGSGGVPSALVQPVDQAMAARIDLAFALGCAAFVARTLEADPGHPAACQELAGGFAVFGGSRDPVVRAMALGTRRPVVEADLDAVASLFRERGAPPRLEVGPLSHPSLLEQLAKRPLRIVMMLSVHQCTLDGSLPSTAPRIEVTRVGSGELAEFADTVGRGFNSGEPAPEHLAERSILSLRTPGAIGFLARVGGRAAGGGTVLIEEPPAGRTACLIGGCTLPSMRGRGVQLALLAARLLSAREAGCDLAVTSCAPGSASERNICRAGFSLVYTKAILELL
jgi:hypothetical protein